MTDPTEFARALRGGSGGAEYGPLAAADLIEHLALRLAETQAHVRELETIVYSERVRGQARDAYARGFRACQVALADTVPPGSEAESQIMSVQPDFAAAGLAARSAN